MNPSSIVSAMSTPEPVIPADDQELTRQMAQAVERASELFATARHYLTDGSGLGLVELSPAEQTEACVLSARFLALAHPTAMHDVKAASVGMLRSLLVCKRNDLLGGELHSEKKRYAEAYDALIAAIATEETIGILMASAGAILDSRVTLAVRYPYAIVVGGVVRELHLIGGVFMWPEEPDHCDSCGDLLTEFQEDEGKPVILRVPAGAPCVQCSSCESLFEITPRVAYLGVRR